MAEPPITLRAVHDSGPLPMPVTRIVIHATCPNVGYPKASEPGSAMGTAHYFQDPKAGGSAHYVEDSWTETHCVPDNVEAWHAPPNDNSIGIEICAEGGDYPANYTREQWLSPQVWPGVQRAAARARELCDRFGVPKVKIGPAQLLAGAHGICGHVDVSQAWHQSDHSDPGKFFPWPEFMAEVNGTSGGFLMALDDAAQQHLADMIGGIYSVVVSAKKGADGELLDRSRTTDAGVAALLARNGNIDAAAIAAAIPHDIAQQVIDALGAKLSHP
jgi:hypothetical protein